MELTADSVCIKQNDELGIFELFYTLDRDEVFEKLESELFKTHVLMYSDEYEDDLDEVEDWFFDNSEASEYDAKAKELYNLNIGRNDIRVECSETRVAIVNGIKFTVSATASKEEMYKNKRAKKMIELKMF